ncbi:hypothetical protein AOLI_G00198660 [Acnodon oligacanthus]
MWTNQTLTKTSASKTFAIFSPTAPVSEMERSRVNLVTVMCVLFSKISGAEVEMRVRPGDNVTLYSDCVWKIGFHYTAQWNSSNQTYDLVVKSVSESDLGLYYCAVQEEKITEDETGGGIRKDVYHYGNKSTRLSFLETNPQTPSTPPVSDCSSCWKLLVSVCPVCVLLSSTCIYCILTTTKGSKERREPLTGNVFQVGCVEEHQCEKTMNAESCFHTETGVSGLGKVEKLIQDLMSAFEV